MTRPALHLQTKHLDPPPPSLVVSVHSLTAKFSLNRPETDLVPTLYLRKADRSPVVERSPWVFRSDIQDARPVDLSRWSKYDIRYRGVFRTLQKVPAFANGLYEDVCDVERVSTASVSQTTPFQDQVVYALLSELFEMMDLRHPVNGDKSFFFLRPRLLNLNLEYLTGYREKHKDAPTTAGFVSLDFRGVCGRPRMILPVSTTKEKEPLQSSLKGKFKLILAQLALSILHLRPPGDKLPDQEVFLVGLHGSRLHLLRAIFPGRKTSHLWCGKPALRASVSSPVSPPPPPPPPPPFSPRFYSKENIDQLMGRVKQSAPADPEDNMRTFRVVGSREYDLWRADDFRDAVRLLVGLGLYLMSGKAKCGSLQKTFEEFPHTEETTETEAELAARRRKAIREHLETLLREKRMEREERRERARQRQRVFNRASAGDQIRGFGDIRCDGWDWVWEDKQADPPSSEEDEDAILNSACMSGRPAWTAGMRG